MDLEYLIPRFDRVGVRFAEGARDAFFDQLLDTDTEVVIIALMREAVVLVCVIHGNSRLGGREPGHLTSVVTVHSQ
jgi:hypothetical protein